MGNKYTRAGGKFGGSHTTLIPAACIIADIADACQFVTKISPGFIKAGLKSVNGKRRAKITDESRDILLSIRDNTSHQEVRVYASNIEAAKRDIAQGAEEAGFVVSFMER